MTSYKRHILAGGVVAVALTASCGLFNRQPNPKPPMAPPAKLTQLEPGVYGVSAVAVDQLLSLKDYPDLKMLVLPQPLERVSDAHMLKLRDWVNEGGVVWVESPAVTKESGLLLVAPIRVQDFDFQKTSKGSNNSGELVVRGSTNRMKIDDHVLTEGVNELYVYPRFRFDGTLNAEPIVEMTDTEGNHGVVIAAIPLGNGLVVLDGTAREGSITGSPKGFDPEHPNAVRTGEKWNSYDWAQLMNNARNYGSATARR